MSVELQQPKGTETEGIKNYKALQKPRCSKHYLVKKKESEQERTQGRRRRGERERERREGKKNTLVTNRIA